MPNLTINVTSNLLYQSKLYALRHSTTLSNIVRSNLIELVKENSSIIQRYSDGSISSIDAKKELKLESVDELFVEVCSSGHELFHINRKKAEQLAANAILVSGMKK